MRTVSRWFSRFIALALLAAMASAVAAALARQRVVRHADPESDDVELVAIFEPLGFRSRSTAFRGGSLLTWFGGGTLDLRQATLDAAGATLRVRAIFGGGQIVVPETWRVTLRILPIFGGVADARPRVERAADAPELVVEGLALFGGFVVQSDLAPGQERWLGSLVGEAGPPKPAA